MRAYISDQHIRERYATKTTSYLVFGLRNEDLGRQDAPVLGEVSIQHIVRDPVGGYSRDEHGPRYAFMRWVVRSHMLVCISSRRTSGLDSPGVLRGGFCHVELARGVKVVRVAPGLVE